MTNENTQALPIKVCSMVEKEEIKIDAISYDNCCRIVQFKEYDNNQV